ncbi:LOW QUALITY PROTEIN: TPR and ankyrin repeat-containing protein 1-like [Ptychodera flava]|uniref:LOW QUALITY PROTEIN: TPR and ankyrin repeat-containing protein 1-like n=1 Tax=Ptychodera flava TaxID=63121 RepID=UPI00396A532D
MDAFAVYYQIKETGNRLLKEGRFFEAVQAYSTALTVTLPGDNKEESIILSNRSHAYFKLNQFDWAVNDALECITRNRTWWKGYYRASCAFKQMNKNHDALMVLVDGLRFVKNSGNYAKENTITFLVDIAKLVNKVTDGMQLLHKCQAPREIWSQVVLKLAKQNDWDAIHKLFLGGGQGKRPGVGGVATGCDTSVVRIDQLCRNQGKTDGGMALASELIKHGSDPSALYFVNEEPAMHCALRYGLHRGNFILLKHLFEKYPKAGEEANMTTKRGESLYHILVLVAAGQQITETAMRILINNNANPCLKDRSGRMALDYLHSQSQPAFLLRKAMEKYFDQTQKQQTSSKIQTKAPAPQEQNTTGRKTGPSTEQRDKSSKQQDQSASVDRQSETRRDTQKDVYQTALSMKIKEKWHEALKGFCKFINDQHLNSFSANDVRRSKDNIIEILQHVREVHAKVECRAPPSIWKFHIQSLVTRGLWGQVYLLLNGGGNGSPFGKGGIANGCDMSDVNIQTYLSSGHTDRRIKKYELVKTLLDHGANPDGLDPNSMPPLAYSLRLLEDGQLVSLLLQYDADPSSLSLNDGDTPLHAALKFSLQKKDHTFRILKTLFEKYKHDPASNPNLDPCIQDDGGNTLFHMLIQGPCTPICLNAVKLLQEYKVDPQIKNGQGKIPLNSLKKDDRRLPYLKIAAQHHPTVRPRAKKVKEKSKTTTQPEPVNEVKSEFQNVEMPATKTTTIPDDGIRVAAVEGSSVGKPSKEEIKRRILAAIEEIPQFIAKRPKFDTTPEQEIPRKDLAPTTQMKGPKETHTCAEGSDKNEVHEVEEAEDVETKENTEEETDEMDELDPSLFDDLAWEVECTSAVWKILRDKRLEQGMKVRIINKIRLLASGIWRPDLAKRLEGAAKQHDIQLFEAKLTKAARILWELAIAFSPRCSEDPERRLQIAATKEFDDYTNTVGGRIYSEVIRVWDIVFDHDNVSRSIDNIVKSHQRGHDCIIRKNLKGIDRKEFRKGKSATEERIPMLYREMTSSKRKPAAVKKRSKALDAAKLFFPPASSNETEYHIMKFYSFSSTLVNSILLNEDIKVDFPFRVTELEHAIINLQPDPPSAILLLGRSGTGKTTCCLYRLWTYFIRYWEAATKTGDLEPLLPRDTTFIDVNEKDNNDDDDDEEDDDNGGEKGGDGDRTAKDGNESLGATSTEFATCQAVTDCGAPDTNANDDLETVGDGIAMDHLHQIFVTKNAVLCSEVEKNFRDLSHAHDAAKEHVAVEDNSLPYRLQDAHPAQYPMFLTSRQWLLMMDATLPEPYFPRKPDGSLKREVKGWGIDERPLSFIPQLEDRDDDDDEDEDANEAQQAEDEDDEETLDMTVKDEQGRQRKEIDPRKEVTYEVFAYELWSKINKNKVDYHPTLVWMEIKSFIHGSIEALHTTNGHLSLEQYEELGRKRAPNFTADRREIYKLFEKYKGTKRQRGLFDESDLVFSVYHRLKKVEFPDWCIHQFYIDETQDFTQAELSLLIRCCSNPNALFLTGDTAQSIMRGVAFRFDDLKTLFHYASKSMKAIGKTSQVKVPKKVYQLTHNYRSHAGILDLATSVVDLMIEFFPESFDRLQRDQGLFDGPQPVLLESCSFSDLALLLRGNKRKTSEIEFGAHQVILVANEEAKDALPKELSLGLVLTIYESKGLEFDDVLLYNFFKDSPAQKEWRVVISYLETLIKKGGNVRVTRTGQSLVEIDQSETVEQNLTTTRPLEFDHDKHKVLNSELKYLYTAVTRARVNVWIFDEDREKRAPMFEYFRKRKLVQVVRIEDNESGQEGLSDGMFATTSTRDEWNKRGDYFYNNKLWKVAAKCYFKGGNGQKEMMALAQDRALNAEKLRDNPRRLRAEFLAAADEFMQCDMYQQASSCLYNAKEYELSAMLFEKIGKFTNAALLNDKRLKKPFDAARCYEQAGNYKKALELLYSLEAFDKAADVVERYNLKKKEYEEKSLPLPEHLLRNAPGIVHTMERLSFSAAEKHYNVREFEKMNAAISRFPKFEDKLQFLRSRDRIEEAANLLKENGRKVEAAKLMRSKGKLKEALDLTESKEDVTLRAEILLACSRIHLQQNLADNSEVLSYLEEATALFREANNSDGEAECLMLIASSKKDENMLKSAQNLFAKTKNIRGQIECVDVLVKNWPLTVEVVQRSVLHALEQLFKLISVLYKPTEIDERHMTSLCESFYGLKEVGPNEREVLIYEGARFLTIDHAMPSPSSTGSNIVTAAKEVGISTARTRIIKHLFSMASHWVKTRDILKDEQTKYSQCQDYIIGLSCQKKGCPQLHENYKRFAYFKYLIALTAEIMLTDVLLRSAKLPHFDIMRGEMESWCATEEEADQLCLLLHQALLPKPYHLRISSEKPAAFVDVLKIVRRFSVKKQLREVAERKWNAASILDKRSNSDLYFLIWMFHLLIQEDVNIFKGWINDMQRSYWHEVVRVHKTKHPEKIHSSVGLIAVGEGRNVNFFSMIHPFLESARYLHEGNDPVQSVGSFNRFIGLPAKRAVPPLIPSICNVLMMLELKYTLCMTMVTKFKNVNVTIPASYLAQVTFFDMLCAPKKGRQHHMYAAVNLANVDHESLYQLGGHIRFMVNLLCGELFSGNFNVLNDSFIAGNGDFIKTGEAERCLVLALVMLSNIGIVTPLICEQTLRKHLMQIKVKKTFPQRVADALKAVQRAQGIQDVIVALKTLLAKRDDERLYQCRWMWNTWQGGVKGLHYQPVSEKKYQNSFNRPLPIGINIPADGNDSNESDDDDDGDDDDGSFGGGDSGVGGNHGGAKDGMLASTETTGENDEYDDNNEGHDEPLEMTGMSAEEIQRASEDQAKHNRHQAANTIIRNFKRYRLLRNLSVLVLKKRYGILMDYDIADQTSSPKQAPTAADIDWLSQLSTVSDKMCGICGVILASGDETMESINQYGQIELDMEDEHDVLIEEPQSPESMSQQNPLSPRSPTSYTDLMWPGRQEASEAGDVSPVTPTDDSLSHALGPWGALPGEQMKSGLPTFKIHMQNVEHWEKTRLFKIYKTTFVEIIHPTVSDCESFFAKTSDESKKSTPLALDIQQLKAAKKTLDEEISDVHRTRSWERGQQVKELAEKVKTSLEKVKNLLHDITTEGGLATGATPADGIGIGEDAEEAVVLATEDGDREDEAGHLLKVDKSYKKKDRKKRPRGGRKK